MMARKARKIPPAVCAGEVGQEWYMKTRAILSHLWLEQHGIEHGAIDVWDEKNPKEVYTFQF